MNFKLKALAAAVALSAVAGQAAADIQPGNNATSAPNSELVFFAFGLDGSGNAATYVKDLGVTYDAFLASPSYASVDLNADANWTNFTSAAVDGSRYWGVFATQRNAGAISSANTYKMLTTATADDIAVIDDNYVGTSLINGFNNANAGIIAINGAGTDYAANASYFFDFSDTTQANLGYYLGATYGDQFLPMVNEMGVTTTAKFWDVAKAAGLPAAAAPSYADVANGYVWSLNAQNQLAFAAAVPEPETYAMFLAGLGLMGFMARRRRVI